MQTETKAIEEHIIKALFSNPDIFSFGLNDPTLLLLDFFLFLRLKKELLRFICFILLLLDIPDRIFVSIWSQTLCNTVWLSTLILVFQILRL